MAFANTPSFGIGGAPRVNLMPRAEIDRRERSVLVRRWAWALVAALLVVAAVSAGTFYLQWAAQQRLAAANATTTTLLTDLAGLTDVREAVALETELTDFRADAMATDLSWSTFVSQVDAVVPAPAILAGFELSSGTVPIGNDPALEIGAVGSFGFNSPTPIEIVPLIRAVRALPGVVEADGWELTSEGDAEIRKYTYLLRVGVDQTIYTNAYAEAVAE